MLPHLESPTLSSLHGVRHAFFTRHGGASEGIFASLNCGLGSADTRTSVIENRARAATHLGVAPWQLLTVYQCHSPECVTVETPWTEGQSPEADAMATRSPGVALGILAADCAPLLFADTKAGVIGAAHAGWKGALGGVIESTLEAMERLGARRADIVAAIGPCIGPRSYEVGPEFEARFRAADSTYGSFFAADTRSDRFLFDLPAFAAARVRAAGVALVDPPPADTYAQEQDFFSYRRATHRGEPDYGRNLSAIVLA